jgi:hypothetical protein
MNSFSVLLNFTNEFAPVEIGNLDNTGPETKAPKICSFFGKKHKKYLILDAMK